jgi:hypothetical protein
VEVFILEDGIMAIKMVMEFILLMMAILLPIALIANIMWVIGQW